MIFGFTPKQIGILHKLYTIKIEPGTLRDISTFLDGENSVHTQLFLSDLAKLSILTLYSGTNRSLNITNGIKSIRGREWPTYIVNKDKLKFVWKQKIEYKLSVAIFRDEAIVLAD